MSHRFTTVTLVLCIGTARAMGCTEAVVALDNVAFLCPADGETDKRTPGSCGDKTCGTFLKNFTDAKVNDMMNAFLSCSNDLEAYTAYGHFGSDWFKVHVVKQAADECGQSSSFVGSVPGLDTCIGGSNHLMSWESACPKQCLKEREEGNMLPVCYSGQREHSTESCGTKMCGDALEAVTEEQYQTSVQGMLACDQNGVFAAYKEYATMLGGDYLKLGIAELSWACGLKDKFRLMEPSVNTCAGARMLFNRALFACAETLEGIRTQSSCGTETCKTWLVRASAEVNETKLGLKTCSEQSWVDEAVGWETHVRKIASDCGYSYDDLAPPRCLRMRRTNYNQLIASGMNVTRCD